MLPRLKDLMVTMTKDDPKLNDQFRIYLVDWYMHRVYDELNGPLTDAIAPIPPLKSALWPRGTAKWHRHQTPVAT